MPARRPPGPPWDTSWGPRPPRQAHTLRPRIWAIRRRRVPTLTPPAMSACCSVLTPPAPPAPQAPLAARRTPTPLATSRQPGTSRRSRPARQAPARVHQAPAPARQAPARVHRTPARVHQAPLRTRRVTPPLTPRRVRALRLALTQRRARILRRARPPCPLPPRPQGPPPLHTLRQSPRRLPVRT